MTYFRLLLRTARRSRAATRGNPYFTIRRCVQFAAGSLEDARMEGDCRFDREHDTAGY